MENIESVEPMTMAEKADAAVKIGRYFQCVVDVSRELERIGSLEQAEAEINSRIAGARKDLDTLIDDCAHARTELAGANGNILEAKKELETFRKSHADELERLEDLKKQTAEAEETKADALKDAEQIISDANAKADVVIANAELVFANANKVKDEAAADRQKADEEVAAKKAEVAAATQELADIEARIAAAKEQVSKVFVGFGSGL